MDLRLGVMLLFLAPLTARTQADKAINPYFLLVPLSQKVREVLKWLVKLNKVDRDCCLSHPQRHTDINTRAILIFSSSVCEAVCSIVRKGLRDVLLCNLPSPQIWEVISKPLKIQHCTHVIKEPLAEKLTLALYSFPPFYTRWPPFIPLSVCPVICLSVSGQAVKSSSPQKNKLHFFCIFVVKIFWFFHI